MNGKLIFASKSGDSKLQQVIEERYLQQKKDSTLIQFCEGWIEKGFTPLFEWCSLRTRIVLEYEEDLLVLLAIRNNNSGNYVPYNEVCESAQNYKDVRVAERWKIGRASCRERV